MNKAFDFEAELIEDETVSMPSLKHSLVQTNIAGILFGDERWHVFIELSLDVTSIDLNSFGLKARDELIPDISVYREPPPLDDQPGSDIIRVSQMPDLAIEVLSPSQTLNELLKKMNAYLALNIKSCWLVIPALEEVRVCSQVQCYKNFDINDQEIVDEVMDIHLPIQKVFRPRWASHNQLG